MSFNWLPVMVSERSPLESCTGVADSATTIDCDAWPICRTMLPAEWNSLARISRPVSSDFLNPGAVTVSV